MLEIEFFKYSQLLSDYGLMHGDLLFLGDGTNLKGALVQIAQDKLEASIAKDIRDRPEMWLPGVTKEQKQASVELMLKNAKERHSENANLLFKRYVNNGIQFVISVLENYLRHVLRVTIAGDNRLPLRWEKTIPDQQRISITLNQLLEIQAATPEDRYSVFLRITGIENKLQYSSVKDLLTLLYRFGVTSQNVLDFKANADAGPRDYKANEKYLERLVEARDKFTHQLEVPFGTKDDFTTAIEFSLGFMLSIAKATWKTLGTPVDIFRQMQEAVQQKEDVTQIPVSPE